MKRPHILVAAIGAAFAAIALTPVPAVAGNVAWSVSIGGPGFAISAGQPGFVGAPWTGRPAHAHWRPAFRPGVVARPVVVAPWLAPIAAPGLVPRPVFVPRAVVVRPAPVPVAPRHIVFAPSPRYGYY
ncbi:MAG: hypothetical protein IT517_14915 [Burkholderiales bacterium]|nr:hypothetical protein [Burkholderiales bacterium]